MDIKIYFTNRKKASITVFIIVMVLFLILNSTVSVHSVPTSFNLDPTYKQQHLNEKSSTNNVLKGYTLLCFSPIDDTKNLTLVDMDGTIIHKWKLVDMWGKMFPGGAIIGPTNARDGYVMGREFKQVIQEKWDGTVVWNFTKGDDDNTGNPMARSHHDIQRIGNPIYYTPEGQYVSEGNTLVLAHYNETVESISYKELVDDVIYEVDWNGNKTSFEWHASDHFHQMGFDSLKKIGIYFFPGYPIGFPKKLRNIFNIKNDWLHINSMSILGDNRWYENGDERFNPDNILISSRHANFLAIISKKTGDIVWRVGPDFSQNTIEGRSIGQIIGPHHVHMIPKGLPGAGNIMVFDNGGIAGYGLLGMPTDFRFYSRVIEFNPITLDLEWEYKHNNGLKIIPKGEYHKFFSSTVSSSQRLPNGNTLITEGRSKRVFEVNRQGDILWELMWSHDLYRAYRIPPEWVPKNPSGYETWQ